MLHIARAHLWPGLLALGLSSILAAPARAQAIGAGGRLGQAVRALSTPALGWDNGKQGAFIVALASDARGEVWAGTEDRGVWRYQPRSKKWTQFTVKDGLGDDNAYAIAIDRRGRVWVGHLNHGLSVWNGRQWRNFPIGEGPMGERVFALATSPEDGDVWAATNAGLARYSLAKDSWSYRTRGDGLPSDQATALAFDSFGNLYVGTACDGIAVSPPDSDYRQFESVRGPLGLPRAAGGEGLPGNEINDLSIGRDDVILAATTRGLARSRDRGESWQFERGLDWKAKLDGLHRPLAPENPEKNVATALLLREDYVSCLARDGRGRVWIGFRQKGYEVRDPNDKRALYTSASDDKQQFPYVSAILPRPDSPPLLAVYGGGLQWGAEVPGSADVLADAPNGNVADAENQEEAPLPSPAQVLGVAQLDALTARVSQWKTPLKPGEAVVNTEDWRTGGDWVSRYGRQRAVLCAAGSPLNHSVFRGPDYNHLVGQLGPHRTPDDSLRHWLHWKQTDLGKVLYDPQVGVRRQSEWDDHGETYPMTWDGPDVWVTLRIPQGAHRLSLYFMNKDGHEANNRMRDYLIELRRAPDDLRAEPVPFETKGISGAEFAKHFTDLWKQREEILEPLEAQPPLAKSRVRDFWGGVYKSFVIVGPATYWVKVARNYSFNTIVSSVMLDKISGPKTYWDDDRATFMGTVRDTPPDPDAPPPIDPFLLDKVLAGQNVAPMPKTDEQKASERIVAAARRLWNAVEEKQGTREAALQGWALRFQALRAAQTADAPQVLGANWRWKLALWTPQDRSQWAQIMAQARKEDLQLYPRSATGY